MRFFQKAGNMFAAGLIIFFFVPWVKMWMFQGSAYDIAVNIKDQATMLWGIPLLGVAVIVLGILEDDFGLYKIVSCAAGASPFIAIIWGISQLGGFDQLGSDFFQIFSFGAYASMIVGIGLILSALNVIKMPVGVESKEQ